ncbi:hypothetical protein, partial [Azotobacter vinelandii]|uniref:hypothetical protein n=1 Tax=Azotobacter vinelandii TaxID=354 RepID=UPI0022F2E8D6
LSLHWKHAMRSPELMYNDERGSDRLRDALPGGIRHANTAHAKTPKRPDLAVRRIPLLMRHFVLSLMCAEEKPVVANV